MQEEEKREEGKKVATKLEALDEQLQKVSDKLEITTSPDTMLDAQTGGTLVDELIEKIDVMMQRIDMIATEVRKLR